MSPARRAGADPGHGDRPAADQRQTSGAGTHVGVLVVTDDLGREVRVLSQNENLVAWTSWSTKPAALAPHPITFMTTAGRPISNADLDLANGREVVVVVAPTTESMRVPAMLAAFRPLLQPTGYGGPWVPAERLSRLAPGAAR